MIKWVVVDCVPPLLLSDSILIQVQICGTKIDQIHKQVIYINYTDNEIIHVYFTIIQMITVCF